MKGISTFHSTVSCLNSYKHELNFQISAMPCVHGQLVDQQRTAGPRKAGGKTTENLHWGDINVHSKNKGNVNCHLGFGQGSTQPCLQSWLSATLTVSGQWKETPQETATLVS